MAEVEGLEEILKKMDSLAKGGGDRVASSMVRAGLNVVAKQMKKDLSPKVKEARKAVRTRFKRKKKAGTVEALVGFGVGKRKKKPPKVVNSQGNRKGGIGIGAQNIHWWVAGTQARYAGISYRRKEITGSRIHATGKMPAMQPGLAAIAYAKSKGKIQAEMIKRGALQLTKEINKG